MKKLYCVICGKYRKFQNRKMPNIFGKTVLSIICSRSRMKMKKYLKKDESIEISKILGLIENI